MVRYLFGEPPDGDKIAREAIADYKRGHDEMDVIRRLKEALERGLSIFPVDQVHVYIGAAYDDIGLVDEAIVAYERALSLKPDCSTALSNLGLLCANRGDFKRAQQLYERAIEVQPGNGYAHNNLGMLSYKIGRYADARDAFKRALDLNPSIEVAFANLARCHAYLGDFQAAQQAFQEASRRRYKGTDGLRRELEEIRENLPVVYFDHHAYGRLAAQLLPHDSDLHEQISRAAEHPQEMHKELCAQGDVLFLEDYVISRALGWVLLCRDIARRGLGLRWGSIAVDASIDLLVEAGKSQGLELTNSSGTDVAATLREALQAKGDPDPSDSEILRAFIDHALIAQPDLVMLALCETPERDLICVLSRTHWEAALYPFTSGPDGYGLVRVLEPRTPPTS